MTQKELAIEEVFLTECDICHGDGFVTHGEFDNEEIVDCVCRKEAKAERDAEGREDNNKDY